jgi:hypothetical protein
MQINPGLDRATKSPKKGEGTPISAKITIDETAVQR